MEEMMSGTNDEANENIKHIIHDKEEDERY